MPRTTVVAALAALCLAAPPVAAQQTFSVRAGPVVPMAANHFPDRRARVTGSFEFVADPTGIATSKRGGACLVADLSAQGIGKRACRTDLDCNPVVRVTRTPGLPDRPGVVVPGYEGYCLKSNVHPSAPRMCWVRPGSQATHCTLSRTADLTERRYELPRVHARPAAGTGVVRWRVHTCLNPPMVAGATPPCAVRGAPGKQALDGPILSLGR